MLQFVVRGTIRHSLRVFAILFLVIAVLLIFIRMITPQINRELAHVGTWFAEELQLPISIRKTHFGWSGGYLVIRFDDLQLFDQHKEIPLVHADETFLRIKPIASLLARKLIFKELAISGIDLIVIQHPDESVTFSGFDISHIIDNKNSAKMDWSAFFSRFPIESLTVHHANLRVIKQNHFYHKLIDLDAIISRTSEGLNLRSHATLLSEKERTPVTLGVDVNLQDLKSPLKIYMAASNVGLKPLKNWVGYTDTVPVLDGTLNLKLWLDFQQGQISKLTTKFEAYNLLLPTHTKTPIHVNQVNGQLRFVETGTEAWKFWGEQFVLDHQEKEIRFSLEKHQSDLSKPRYTWVIKNVDLNDFNPLLQNSALLPEKIQNVVKMYQPKGFIAYAAATHGMTTQDFSNLLLDMRNIQLKETSVSPGFSGLDVIVSADNHTGSAQLMSDSAFIRYHSVSGPNITEIKELQGTTQWWADDSKWRVENQWGFYWEQEPVDAIWKLFSEKGQPLELEAVVTAPTLPGVPIGLGFPKAILEDQDGADWLKQAVKEGTLLDTVMVFRGPIIQDPYAGHRGVFQALTYVQEGQLYFDPEWPTIDHLNAELRFENYSFEAKTQYAEIGESVIESLSAIIPNFEKSVLYINGFLSSTCEKAENILRQSPLAMDFQRLFAMVALQGDLEMSLGMVIPLEGDTPLTITGDLNIDKARAYVPAIDVDLKQFQGSAHFSEKTVLANFSSVFLGAPIGLQVAGDLVGHHGGVRILADTHLGIRKLLEWKKIPDLPGISGETDFTADIYIPSEENNPTICKIIAPLLETEITLPEPFSKVVNVVRPLSLEVEVPDNKPLSVYATLGDDVQLFTRIKETKTGWMPLNFHLHFGDKKSKPNFSEQYFLIDGSLSTLVIQNWYDWITRYQKTVFSKNKMEPSWKINLFADRLDAYDFLFHQAHVETTLPAPLFEVQIASQELTGNLSWETKKYPEVDVLKGQLQFLVLPEVLFKNPIKKDELKQIRWPMVHLEVEDFRKGRVHLENLLVDLVPTEPGYIIQHLNSQSNQMSFTTHGYWHFLNDLKPTALEGVWDTKNIGHTLQQLGFDTNLKDARSHVVFDLKWQGDLLEHLPTLEGHIEFMMKGGRILGVNPGLGRVFSLFNIENVRRRLQLDFSDLYKSGFSFDTLEGHVLAAKSALITEDLLIKGPVAEVQGKGHVSLETQNVDAHLKVFPKVSGTLPMAAAVAAGNPAIGAAIWVFDKLLNQKKSLQSYEYQLTGTWTDPIVTDTQKNKFKLPGQK